MDHTLRRSSLLVATAAIGLCLAATASAQEDDEEKGEKYSLTYNHAVVAGQDAEPPPVVEARIESRLNKNGAYAFYRAKDFHERDFVVQSRDALEIGPLYHLTGHVDKKQKDEGGNLVFVVSDAQKLGFPWLWLIGGVIVASGVGLIVAYPKIYARKERIRIRRQDEIAKVGVGQTKTTVAAPNRTSGTANVPAKFNGLEVDSGFAVPKTLKDLVFREETAIDVELGGQWQLATVYQISRESGTVDPKPTCRLGNPAREVAVHHQIRLKDPNTEYPALSRGGSLIFLCADGNKTYVAASVGAASPAVHVRNDVETLITESIPLLLESGDELRIGHFTFTYRVGARPRF